MIRIKRKVVEIEAKCDSCGNDLVYYLHHSPDPDHANINYASLVHEFGYGSMLDSLCAVEYHLCAGCYVKVLDLLKLQIPT
jgi:hypothetical protein